MNQDELSAFVGEVGEALDLLQNWAPDAHVMPPDVAEAWDAAFDGLLALAGALNQAEVER